jgi:hypothetical protein
MSFSPPRLRRGSPGCSSTAEASPAANSGKLGLLTSQYRAAFSLCDLPPLP